ncbi:hypothetical protein LCGC14_2710650, partial [marine sediment metagenome]
MSPTLHNRGVRALVAFAVAGLLG